MNEVGGLTREEMREGILQLYGELEREHRRPPTMKELMELTGDVAPVHLIKAFLGVAGKHLTDGRQLRYQR